jgi:hypothetical protein
MQKQADVQENVINKTREESREFSHRIEIIEKELINVVKGGVSAYGNFTPSQRVKLYFLLSRLQMCAWHC